MKDASPQGAAAISLQTEHAFDASCAQRLEEIFAVYEALGYPRAAVTQWSLPAPDVHDLCRLARASEATRILEVGSFVGTGAFLLAHAAPGATVHSVDPNLPLDIEFTAMGAASYGADVRRTTLEVARASAERLGLGARVQFHAGGFAVGSTFALDEQPVPVIGPRLIEELGPFGFIFVDGLHFEEAVIADTTLALRAIAPHGTIALHDAIGYWGSHVRRAVHRVLESDETLSFCHAPYAALHRGIGTLSRKARREIAFDERARATYGDIASLGKHLGRLMRTLFPTADAVLRTESELDRAVCDTMRSSAWTRAQSGGACAMALTGVDDLSPRDQTAALSRITEGADAVLLGGSPPGEDRAAGAWARPLASRVEALDRLGFRLYDLVYPFLEPYTHAFGSRVAVPRKSSFLLDTMIAVRKGSALEVSLAAHAPLDAPRARALTDLRLQILFGGHRLREVESQLMHTQEQLVQSGQALAHWSRWRVHLGRAHFWERRS
ncbi:MAG: class I SAM-dependent methyltransferase [Limnohabitans sp.]|nr:class I SAM-dependent methyltransferase [Limnohabitans sp.]